MRPHALLFQWVVGFGVQLSDIHLLPLVAHFPQMAHSTSPRALHSACLCQVLHWRKLLQTVSLVSVGGTLIQREGLLYLELSPSLVPAMRAPL